MRYLYRLLCVIGFMLPLASTGQSNWPTTRIDNQATVQMPYEGTLDEDAKIPGAQRFWTSTSDNEFQIVRTDLRYIPGYNPDAALSEPSLRQVYEKAAKLYNKHIIKGKILSHGTVVFSGKPALATLYRGFDDYRQRPINIETIWLYHGQALYLLTCSYAIPEEVGASEDKKHFFSSFRIDDNLPTREP